jgi:hypothetical protein
MNTVHLVWQSGWSSWDHAFWQRLVGVFATRELANTFVQTRKTPGSHHVESVEVFEDLKGCRFFNAPK